MDEGFDEVIEDRESVFAKRDAESACLARQQQKLWQGCSDRLKTVKQETKDLWTNGIRA